MDGSAAPFIYLIQEAGVKRLQAPRKYLKIIRPIAISRGDKRIALYPSDHFKVTYSVSYDHPLLRHQTRTMRITEETFVEEIAPARTFTFLKDVEMLRQNGLALGGSLENAIVLGETGVLNNALRFEDEFVRHRILDAIGDLALVGYPVIGHSSRTVPATRSTRSSRRRFSKRRTRGGSSRRWIRPRCRSVSRSSTSRRGSRTSRHLPNVWRGASAPATPLSRTLKRARYVVQNAAALAPFHLKLMGFYLRPIQRCLIWSQTCARGASVAKQTQSEEDVMRSVLATRSRGAGRSGGGAGAGAP